MQDRWKALSVMALLAVGSAWLLNEISPGSSVIKKQAPHQPDYYMENFKSMIMDKDGLPKNLLSAEYLAHYPDDETTELIRPWLEVKRKDGDPVHIIADKGWVTEDNKVILLSGKVTLWQNDAEGKRKLEIVTNDVRILADQEYAETDKPSTLTGNDTVVKATGVRAYLKEGRLELLHNVHATISPH